MPALIAGGWRLRFSSRSLPPFRAARLGRQGQSRASNERYPSHGPGRVHRAHHILDHLTLLAIHGARILRHSTERAAGESAETRLSFRTDRHLTSLPKRAAKTFVSPAIGSNAARSARSATSGARAANALICSSIHSRASF